MIITTEAVRRLGIRHPLIQGPFGGGLSTVDLVAAVSKRGGLGSYGAHVLAPDEIIGVCKEIRSRTSEPFAINLWVSDHDPGGQALAQSAFDRLVARFAPYFRELGLDDPSPPARFHETFDDQIDALLEAAPRCSASCSAFLRLPFWMPAGSGVS